MNHSFGYEFSKEMESLLSICRARMGLNTGSEFMPYTGPGFLKAARFHRMLPFIFPWLKEHAWDSVPTGMQGKIIQLVKKQKIKGMRISSELVSIVKQLNEMGLETVCLKGPLMTMELYGNILDRHQGDIDLLGRVQDLDRVRFLLEGMGYDVLDAATIQMLSTPGRLKAYMKSTQHVAFFNTEKRILVEFHYRLFKNPYLLPVSSRLLWQNLREMEYGGVVMKRLSLTDSALYLIIHGANHEWYYLKWLVDIAYLTRLENLDWAQLNKRAIDLGVERMVMQALQLAHKLLGSVIPAAMRDVNHQVDDHLIQKLVCRGAQKINSTSRGPDLERKRYLTQLRRGFRYKFYILRMQLHLDSHPQGSKLPDSLFFLHYLTNPFKWFFGRYVGKKREK